MLGAGLQVPSAVAPLATEQTWQSVDTPPPQAELQQRRNRDRP